MILYISKRLLEYIQLYIYIYILDILRRGIQRKKHIGGGGGGIT